MPKLSQDYRVHLLLIMCGFNFLTFPSIGELANTFLASSTSLPNCKKKLKASPEILKHFTFLFYFVLLFKLIKFVVFMSTFRIYLLV